MVEALRVQAEYCDNLQSIITIQSSGGGTGSGLGSALSEIIRDELPEVWRFALAVVPSPNDDVVTSPYNAMLSLSKLALSNDCILPVDNQSLFTIYEKIALQSKKRPSSSLIDNGQRKIYDAKKNEAFDTMNNIVANLMLNLTRYTGFYNHVQLNAL